MLIGRKAELARLTTLLDATEQGESAAVLVVGEAGIGKSALLEAAVAHGADHSFTVLRARGVEAETDIPFAGLSELVAPILHLRESIPAPRAAALGGALALEPSKGQEPFAVAAALVSLLDAAADEAGGVLVAIEDAHWLDEASLEAVLFAARRLHSEGVVVILTARPEPDRGLRRRGLEEIELGGLPPEDATELLRRSAGGNIGEAPLRRLVEAARGNALALVELPRSLSHDQLAGAAPLPEPVRPSAAIDDAFRGELDALPDQVREALTVLAADEGVDPATVMGALERRGLPRSAIEPAERARLVRLEGDGLRFRHPLLRAVVYHSASFAERQAAHSALASALADRGESARSAWHLAAAATEPDEKVAAALEIAGDDARGRGAPSSAAHALERAAELTPDLEQRAQRLLKASRDYARTEQPVQAVAVAERALDMTESPLLRADLQRVRGTVAMRAGKPAFGYDLMTTEAERVAPFDRLRAAEMLVGSSIADRLMGAHGRMRLTAERALQLAGDRSETITGLAELVVAHVLVLSGRRGEGDLLIARHEDLLMTADPDVVPWEVIAAPAHLSVWIGNYDRAERILSRLIQRARERSVVTGLIYPLAVRAQLGLRRGRLGPAAVDGDEALKLAVDTEQAGLAAFAGGILAEVEAALGRDEDARTHAEEALVTWDAAGAEIMGMYGRVALGLLALGCGRPDEAIGPLEWCSRTARRLEIDEPGVFQWAPNLIEAYARMGRTSDAEELLGWLDRTAELTGGTWALACAARCRGLIAAEDEFDAHFERSVELLDGLDAAFEAARSRLCWGERLRRARRRGDAREPLRAALETFERVGARGWAGRARDELRATGQRVARGRTAVSEELTSHELRVALLVARGRTNPEVAAELFVSRKTVEYHLSQVYRKLGLRSRTELAAALASELTDDLDGSPVA